MIRGWWGRMNGGECVAPASAGGRIRKRFGGDFPFQQVLSPSRRLCPKRGTDPFDRVSPNVGNQNR